MRSARFANIWLVPIDPPGEPRSVTSLGGSDNTIAYPETGPDNQIVYSSAQGGFLRIFAIRPGDPQARPLTLDEAHYINYYTSGDGLAVERISPEMISRLWWIPPGGGPGRPLTEGHGEQLVMVSEDGRFAYYNRADAPRDLYEVPVSGGPARLVASDFDAAASLSPDGRYLQYRAFLGASQDGDFVSVVRPLAAGAPPAKVTPPKSARGLQFDDSSRFLSWFDLSQPTRPVNRQSIGGGPIEVVTPFTDGRIIDYRWVAPGRLIVNRLVGQVSNLWLIDHPGAEPVPLTRFPTGRIFEMQATRDNRAIAITYGTLNRDVVLIKDFR